MLYTRFATAKETKANTKSAAVTVCSWLVSTTRQKKGIKLTTPKPPEVVDILARDFDIHPPHSTDDVHRQHDRSQHGQLAQDVRRLFRSFIHQNVDLREIVGMCS